MDISKSCLGVWGEYDDKIVPATLTTMSRRQFLASYGFLGIPAIMIAIVFFFRQYIRARGRARIQRRRSERFAIFAYGELPTPPDDDEKTKKAMIFVLGDIGHSPRMQNHALSLAKNGTKVYLVGYLESEPQDELLYNPLIELVIMDQPPKFPKCLQRTIFFPITAAVKVLHQIFVVWSAMRYECPRTEFTLVQNPPSFPTLLIAPLACWTTNSRLIIDWHNFGFTILALKLGRRHPLVYLLKFLEKHLCHLADCHLCVSRAMARSLRSDLRVTKNMRVVYDRPADIFQPITDSADRFAILSSQAETTQYIQKIMDGRCELLISSTSWTPDENFDILIDALVSYSTLATTERDDLPFLGVIITGKGPLRQHYLQKVAALSAEGRLDRVTVKSAWLPFEDYARVLACATVGISLHTSSSGVDLPMKVLDMFGAGLPVLGWSDYTAWSELVTEGVDGLGFKSADELSDILVRLFEGKGETEELTRLKEGAKAQSLRRWDAEWERAAAPMLGYVEPEPVSATPKDEKKKKKRKKRKADDEMQQEN
ncbi:mannosyltransferase [Ascosphaera aggregata]|nr:mannosyltransferase [Ascosphaera aggregata]